MNGDFSEYRERFSRKVKSRKHGNRTSVIQPKIYREDCWPEWAMFAEMEPFEFFPNQSQVICIVVKSKELQLSLASEDLSELVTTVYV